MVCNQNIYITLFRNKEFLYKMALNIYAIISPFLLVLSNNSPPSNRNESASHITISYSFFLVGHGETIFTFQSVSKFYKGK